MLYINWSLGLKMLSHKSGRDNFSKSQVVRTCPHHTFCKLCPYLYSLFVCRETSSFFLWPIFTHSRTFIVQLLNILCTFFLYVYLFYYFIPFISLVLLLLILLQVYFTILLILNNIHQSKFLVCENVLGNKPYCDSEFWPCMYDFPRCVDFKNPKIN